MASINEKKIMLKNDQFATLRSAKEDDAEKYLNLSKSIISENIYYLNQLDELNLTIDDETKWIKSILENKNHLVLVVELNGELIGQLDFTNGHRRRIAHTGEFGMGVQKDFRGLGVGKFLLEGLISWAQSHSLIEKLNLFVHESNDRAIFMYEKFGFIKEGVRTKDLKYGLQYINTVLMGRELS